MITRGEFETRKAQWDDLNRLQEDDPARVSATGEETRRRAGDVLECSIRKHGMPSPEHAGEGFRMPPERLALASVR
jgi:hypothetical protein